MQSYSSHVSPARDMGQQQQPGGNSSDSISWDDAVDNNTHLPADNAAENGEISSSTSSGTSEGMSGGTSSNAESSASVSMPAPVILFHLATEKRLMLHVCEGRINMGRARNYFECEFLGIKDHGVFPIIDQGELAGYTYHTCFSPGMEYEVVKWSLQGIE